MSEKFQAIMPKPQLTFIIMGHWWGLKQDLTSTNSEDARFWTLETKAISTNFKSFSSGSVRGDSCVLPKLTEITCVLMFLNAAFNLMAGETEARLSL